MVYLIILLQIPVVEYTVIIGELHILRQQMYPIQNIQVHLFHLKTLVELIILQ